MTKKLENLHTLLTGAAGGIGLAVAQRYLEEGAFVSVADIGAQASSGLTELMTQYPNRLIYIPTNVTLSSDIDSLITQASEQFGPIHVLFNNAAIFDMAPLLESDEAMYDKIFAVNVKGAFFVMQKVLAHMVKNNIQGSVVNMASQAGRRGEALVSHYCASKAAVISYTQSAALAMAPHKIRVNGISPGVIATPMWKNVDALFAKYENLPIGEKKIRVGQAVPLGYMGDPTDICGAAVFLASKDASYITAQTLNVDGGNVMS